MAPKRIAAFPVIDPNDIGLSLRTITIIPLSPTIKLPTLNTWELSGPFEVRIMYPPNRIGRLYNRFNIEPRKRLFDILLLVFLIFFFIVHLKYLQNVPKDFQDCVRKNMFHFNFSKLFHP
jgi:hypothetical protein